MIADLLLIVGILMIIGGAWWASPPVAVMIIGILLCMSVVARERNREPNS